MPPPPPHALPLGLALQLPPGRAMQLSLVAEAASAAEAPRELLLGVLTGPELQQALGAAASAAAPAPAVLHLFDAAPGLDSEFSQKATVSLAVAPASFANAVPPTPAPTAAATAAAAAAAAAVCRGGSRGDLSRRPEGAAECERRRIAALAAAA